MSDIQDPSEPFIVVGIDGSDASRDALRWAARQAELTGASLRAVMTWHMPAAAYGTPMPVPVDMDLPGESRRALDRVIADSLDGTAAFKVSSTVVEGHPAVELLRAARAAELLVVGSRGHGAFAGMLLGSVSEHCVSHAPCPVVVVRYSSHPA
ncbi:MAG: universal stress protein [Actinomycetota bacterium]|nr:universal stress protein [Actinomycetota bacterium]